MGCQRTCHRKYSNRLRKFSKKSQNLAQTIQIEIENYQSDSDPNIRCLRKELDQTLFIINIHFDFKNLQCMHIIEFTVMSPIELSYSLADVAAL